MEHECRVVAFRELVEDVQSCRRCPRMEGRARVLSERNGSLSSRILVVAEAPGRLGADKWHIPLYGDQTGRNFEQLLDAASLTREHIFITNAVLCNPRDRAGNNARPSTREIANCSSHLSRIIDMLQPRYVVALGHAALAALRNIAPHDVLLARDVGMAVPWNTRLLIPLYHPGLRACIHRSLERQMADYRALGALLRHEGALT